MTRQRSAFDPETPYLLLDRTISEENIARLQGHLKSLAVPLRPHVKTAKSREVAELVFPDGPGPITVSTLAEAEFFAELGYTDILYAVGLAPAKLPRVADLIRRGVDLTVLLDNVEQATAVARFSRDEGVTVPALIEIDCDGHRGGLPPADPLLLEIARILEPAELRGVMTHAGESYFCYTEEERASAAEQERLAAVTAADRLRRHGYESPVVSIGSTPTAFAARDLTGVTEVRAGNFVFFDLVMAGIGVCDLSDLALSVVTTVIGHQEDKGWILTDAGWMATSSDRGTAVQPVDQGLGLVATRDGEIIDDLIMVDATQEHGALSMRSGSGRAVPDIAVGTELRIFPNHACATASQHGKYYVVAENDGPIEAVWSRLNGW